MSRPMDSLSLVRQATMMDIPVTYNDGFYVFGEHRLHENTKTAFRRSIRSGGYYEVRDIIFYLENIDMPEVDYRKKCMGAGLAAVVTQDKQPLRQYLTGHIDICEQIDYDAVRMEIAKQEEAIAAALKAAEELRSAFKRKEAPNDEDDAFIASVKADRPLLKEIRRGDTSACTSLSVLCKPGSDFSFALKLFQDLVLRPKKEKPSTPTPNLAKKAYGMPIIIIPNALTSIITMANAPHLLTRGEYFPVDAKKLASATVEAETVIHHKYNDMVCEFKLVDNIQRLNERPDYWDRVVAVFVSGQPWQFKGWKWTAPVDIFQNCLGIHLMFADSELNPNIQSWNCKILKVNMIAANSC